MRNSSMYMISVYSTRVMAVKHLGTGILFSQACPVTCIVRCIGSFLPFFKGPNNSKCERLSKNNVLHFLCTRSEKGSLRRPGFVSWLALHHIKYDEKCSKLKLQFLLRYALYVKYRLFYKINRVLETLRSSI